MKKIISIVLCLSMFLCFTACSKKETISYKTFDIDKYKVELPDTYEFNDLVAVKAEPNCVAMLTDKNDKLPDLWVYVDEFGGSSIKEYILSEDAKWDYSEFAVYEKDGKYFAKSVFDEDWYGTALINEGYYRLETDGIFWFDFAYEKTADAKAMHSYIETIADKLGF